MKKVIISALITVAVLLAGSVSEKAPDFSAKTTKGQTFTFSKQAKGVTVINMWATWCVPCMSEMSELTKLHTEYSGKGVAFLSISVDDPKSSAKVLGFANARKWPMTILLDPEKMVYEKLRATTTPTTVVIDENNMIVYRHTGYAKGDEVVLKRVIEETLNKGN